MNAPSSPTPPPSPASSLPSSSSDDSPEAPRQLSNFSTLATSSAPLSVTVSSFSLCISTLSSSMANGSAEPTSSTNGSSSPLMASCSGFFSSDEETVAGGPSASNSEQMSISYAAPADHCPSSSKSRLDVDSFYTCSSNNFSSEVSSSSMDIDISPFLSSDHDNPTFDDEAGCSWGPDSSGGETESAFSQTTLHIDESFSHSSIPSSSNWQQEMPGAMGETVVSRSTWQVKCFKSDTRSEDVSPHWSSDLFTVGADPSDVSSTGPPETDKLLDENASCSRWPLEDSCDHAGDGDALTFSLSQDPVNSSEDVEIPVAMCSQDSSEGAVGMSWSCDSPNSTYTDANISPSPSSTTLNTTVSPSPWPPPLSSFPHSSAAASVSSTQHCPSNSIINSTSVPSVDGSPQVMSWRARASSSPISLTRVTPTTPPPRPPTPPCPSTPPVGRSRRAPGHYASTQRSVSPQERLQSPSTVRRSVSPPLCHPSRSTPPTPSRRSISPPLQGLGLSQRMNSPRRSVSPVALQQALAQPPSPSGRRRLSSRPRSARTPSPRPPRPPNSTPEPSPSPSSQHSPRPHYAKMRGR